jgi:excisionase family DNA binding protein
MSDAQEQLWTIAEVAEYLRVSERTVKSRIADAGLPTLRFGGTVRFSRADIDAWLREGKQASDGAGAP